MNSVSTVMNSEEALTVSQKAERDLLSVINVMGVAIHN